MTNVVPPPPLPTRATLMRVPPRIRAVDQDDFFDWVTLFAEAFEDSGLSYRDDVALRIWQQLGVTGPALAHPAGIQSMVADRSGNLIGLALFSPSLSLTSGARALDIHLAYVHRAGRDQAATGALVEQLVRQAHRFGATTLRWFAVGDAIRSAAGARAVGNVQLAESAV